MTPVRPDEPPLSKKFLVITPEYGTVIPILDDGTGPMEYGCDVLHVRARNRRAAKVLAVRAWRRKGRYSLWVNRNDGNPYVGLKVEPAEYPWKDGDMAPDYEAAEIARLDAVVEPPDWMKICRRCGRHAGFARDDTGDFVSDCCGFPAVDPTREPE